MIYISTSCVRATTIKGCIEFLNKNGFSAIELSGGTDYYEMLEDDVMICKEKYSLSFICHNYFPPPKGHFILNLASLDDDIYNRSLDHLRKGIFLSKKIGACKFGFHAGFFTDGSIDEIGKQFRPRKLYDRKRAIERFCEGFNILKRESDGIKIYVENNVLSYSNKQGFGKSNPFMLTTYDDFLEFKERIDINLLLDIAHLKVTCKSLGLNFEEEFNNLIEHSDYIHISENDGMHDLNLELTKDSSIISLLARKSILKNKTITLEVYAEVEGIKASYELIKRITKC